MIRLLPLLLILASPVVSQPVTIRSGDHEDFVRLVFTIPDGTPWRVGRIESGIGVVLEGVPDGISTAGVFDRISRSRIEDLRIEGDLLAIQLSCECHSDAFLWQEGRLVVDIVDGPSPPGNPFDRPLLAPQLAAHSGSPPTAVLPVVFPDRSGHDRLEGVLPFRFLNAPANASIEEAQVAVVSSLARAATEGFFDVPLEPLQWTFSENGAEPQSESRVIGLSPVTDPMSTLGDRLDIEGSPGLVLRSGLTDSILPDRTEDRRPGTCLPVDQFDVPSWGDDRAFAAQISARRATMTQEFDRYAPGSIEGLARNYIYFGFGAEARRVLMIDGGLTSERLLLDELARIVDGGAIPSGRIAEQIGCGGDVELWSILAIGDLSGADDVILGEAVRALRNLPPSLKEHIGPRLAAFLVDAGFAERSAEIVELLERADSPAPLEVELVRADLAAASGEPAAQQERLTAIAADNARMPPDAMAELLMLGVETGEPPSVDLLELAQVYLHEARPSGGDADLAAAVVRAWIARSELEPAERVLNDTVPSGSDLFASLFNELLSAKVSSLSDKEFLEIALAETDPMVTPTVSSQIAERLIELGFPQQALNALEASGTAQSEQRYLRATAFAKLGDVRSVDAELAGLQSDRARQIRIDALVRSGDYSAALELASPGETIEQRTELAWRAGEWSVLQQSEDELFRSISQLAKQPSFLAPGLAELEARSALLDEAARTRLLAQDLLERFSLDPELDGETR
jgi:hypothetical protein